MKLNYTSNQKSQQQPPIAPKFIRFIAISLNFTMLFFSITPVPIPGFHLSMVYADDCVGSTDPLTSTDSSQTATVDATTDTTTTGTTTEVPSGSIDSTGTTDPCDPICATETTEATLQAKSVSYIESRTFGAGHITVSDIGDGSGNYRIDVARSETDQELLSFYDSQGEWFRNSTFVVSGSSYILSEDDSGNFNITATLTGTDPIDAGLGRIDFNSIGGVITMQETNILAPFTSSSRQYQIKMVDGVEAYLVTDKFLNGAGRSEWRHFEYWEGTKVRRQLLRSTTMPYRTSGHRGVEVTENYDQTGAQNSVNFTVWYEESRTADRVFDFNQENIRVLAPVITPTPASPFYTMEGLFFTSDATKRISVNVNSTGFTISYPAFSGTDPFITIKNTADTAINSSLNGVMSGFPPHNDPTRNPPYYFDVAASDLNFWNDRLNTGVSGITNALLVMRNSLMSAKFFYVDASGQEVWPPEVFALVANATDRLKSSYETIMTTDIRLNTGAFVKSAELWAVLKEELARAGGNVNDRNSYTKLIGLNQEGLIPAQFNAWERLIFNLPFNPIPPTLIGPSLKDQREIILNMIEANPALKATENLVDNFVDKEKFRGALLGTFEQTLAVERAKNLLADKLFQDLNFPEEKASIRSAIQLVSVEGEFTWDGCAGWSVPGQVCTKNIVTGYKVVLGLFDHSNYYGRKYEFHADQLDPVKVITIAAMRDVRVRDDIGFENMMLWPIERVSPDGENPPRYHVEITASGWQRRYQIAYPDQILRIEHKIIGDTSGLWRLMRDLRPNQADPISEVVYTWAQVNDEWRVTDLTYSMRGTSRKFNIKMDYENGAYYSHGGFLFHARAIEQAVLDLNPKFAVPNDRIDINRDGLINQQDIVMLQGAGIDINGDGLVNQLDTNMLMQGADLNRDGLINQQDVVMLQGAGIDINGDGLVNQLDTDMLRQGANVTPDITLNLTDYLQDLSTDVKKHSFILTGSVYSHFYKMENYNILVPGGYAKVKKEVIPIMKEKLVSYFNGYLTDDDLKAIRVAYLEEKPTVGVTSLYDMRLQLYDNTFDFAVTVAGSLVVEADISPVSQAMMLAINNLLESKVSMASIKVIEVDPAEAPLYRVHLAENRINGETHYRYDINLVPDAYKVEMSGIEYMHFSRHPTLIDDSYTISIKFEGPIEGNAYAAIKALEKLFADGKISPVTQSLTLKNFKSYPEPGQERLNFDLIGNTDIFGFRVIKKPFLADPTTDPYTEVTLVWSGANNELSNAIIDLQLRLGPYIIDRTHMTAVRSEDAQGGIVTITYYENTFIYRVLKDSNQTQITAQSQALAEAMRDLRMLRNGSSYGAVLTSEMRVTELKEPSQPGGPYQITIKDNMPYFSDGPSIAYHYEVTLPGDSRLQTNLLLTQLIFEQGDKTTIVEIAGDAGFPSTWNMDDVYALEYAINYLQDRNDWWIKNFKMTSFAFVLPPEDKRADVTEGQYLIGLESNLIKYQFTIQKTYDWYQMISATKSWDPRPTNLEERMLVKAVEDIMSRNSVDNIDEIMLANVYASQEIYDLKFVVSGKEIWYRLLFGKDANGGELIRFKYIYYIDYDGGVPFLRREIGDYDARLEFDNVSMEYQYADVGEPWSHGGIVQINFTFPSGQQIQVDYDHGAGVYFSPLYPLLIKLAVKDWLERNPDRTDPLIHLTVSDYSAGSPIDTGWTTATFNLTDDQSIYRYQVSDEDLQVHLIGNPLPSTMVDRLRVVLGLNDVEWQEVRPLIESDAPVPAQWDGCYGWPAGPNGCPKIEVSGDITILRLYDNEYEFHANRLDPSKWAAGAAIRDLRNEGIALKDIKIVHSGQPVLINEDPALWSYQFDIDLIVRNPDGSDGERWNYDVVWSSFPNTSSSNIQVSVRRHFQIFSPPLDTKIMTITERRNDSETRFDIKDDRPLENRTELDLSIVGTVAKALTADPDLRQGAVSGAAIPLYLKNFEIKTTLLTSCEGSPPFTTYVFQFESETHFYNYTVGIDGVARQDSKTAILRNFEAPLYLNNSNNTAENFLAKIRYNVTTRQLEIINGTAQGTMFPPDGGLPLASHTLSITPRQLRYGTVLELDANNGDHWTIQYKLTQNMLDDPPDPLFTKITIGSWKIQRGQSLSQYIFSTTGYMSQSEVRTTNGTVMTTKKGFYRQTNGRITGKITLEQQRRVSDNTIIFQKATYGAEDPVNRTTRYDFEIRDYGTGNDILNWVTSYEQNVLIISRASVKTKTVDTTAQNYKIQSTASIVNGQTVWTPRRAQNLASTAQPGYFIVQGSKPDIERLGDTTDTNDIFFKLPQPAVALGATGRSVLVTYGEAFDEVSGAYADPRYGFYAYENVTGADGQIRKRILAATNYPTQSTITINGSVYWISISVPDGLVSFSTEPPPMPAPTSGMLTTTTLSATRTSMELDPITTTTPSTTSTALAPNLRAYQSLSSFSLASRIRRAARRY